MSRAVETHSARNPRLLIFHGIVVGLMLVLAGGMAYEQLIRTAKYTERERQQSYRRVIVPGPRGRILDRDGNVLVDNRAHFSVVLNLAELRSEFRAEYRVIKDNYSKLDPAERPSSDQMALIARASVAQRYLDKLNAILHRSEAVRSRDLNQHVTQNLLLPYTLIDDLAPEEYARLLERLPVNSPLQVYATTSRHYPYDSLAAHALGFSGADADPDAEDFPGEELTTFKMKGTIGRDGLEQEFDSYLQGETGGAIYRVDPAGFKVPPALETKAPVAGKTLVTSLDLELQEAAEKAMEGKTGAAVAIDVKTGEVLVMASKPDFNPLVRKPNVPADTPAADMDKLAPWLNRAIQGQYPPGSTFKIVNAVAALRSGAIDPEKQTVECPGYMMIGNRKFLCDEVHGHTDIYKAIARSCNVFFYTAALEMGPKILANEAKRFGFNHPTGIELPREFKSPHVADEDWMQANMHRKWFQGDTANIAIGQGDTLITPLQAACMVASFARGETETKPTILHDPHRAEQHSAAIGLSPSDYNVILEGLRRCYELGTARLSKVEGLSGAAKTGTAQKGSINIAWLVCFAPAENPQIAIAVALEGDEGQNYHGGTYAAPIVHDILEAWKNKRERPPVKPVNFKME